MNADNDTIDLPGELVEGLARLDSNVTVLTPAVDGRVAEAARAHFAERPQHAARLKRRRSTARRWGMVGTVAASLLVGVLLVRTRYVAEPVLPAATVLLASDIDGSGAVDILDAFALARMGAAQGPVTQSEIDAFAMRVVALNGTPRTL